jgi:hypothetical protein
MGWRQAAGFTQDGPSILESRSQPCHCHFGRVGSRGIAPTCPDVVGEVGNIFVAERRKEGWHWKILPARRNTAENHLEDIRRVRREDNAVAGKGRKYVRHSTPSRLMAPAAIL